MEDMRCSCIFRVNSLPYSDLKVERPDSVSEYFPFVIVIISE